MPRVPEQLRRQVRDRAQGRCEYSTVSCRVFCAYSPGESYQSNTSNDAKHNPRYYRSISAFTKGYRTRGNLTTKGRFKTQPVIQGYRRAKPYSFIIRAPDSHKRYDTIISAVEVGKPAVVHEVRQVQIVALDVAGSSLVGHHTPTSPLHERIFVAICGLCSYGCRCSLAHMRR